MRKIALQPWLSWRPRPARRRPWRAARRLPLALLLMLVAILAGCGPEEDELKGPLGPGSGGPAVNDAAVETHPFQSAAGDTIGTFDFDSGQLLHYHPDPEVLTLHVLATIPPDQLLADFADNELLDTLTDTDIVIAFTGIVGRGDTPCRFQAALLARDFGFDIEASGDRRNDRSLKIHQVNLLHKKLRQAQRFYCAELDGNLGIQANVITRPEPVQEWRQVHFVLNSMQPQ